MNIFVKYKDLLIETLKENKKLIGLFAALFFITAIIIYFVQYNLITTNYSAFQATMAPYMNITGPHYKNPIDIFLNNAESVLFSYFGGIFFGLISIFSLLFNGFSLGAQTAGFGFIQSNGTLRFILYIIPHGIFELTATILSPVSGVILFKFIWRFLKDLRKSEGGFKEKVSASYQNNKKIFIQSFVLMVFCIILMIIAAPIECYVSREFSDLILGPAKILI